MASISAFLMNKKNSKNMRAIAIRITKNRRSSYISTGQYILETQWDAKSKTVKKSHPNSKRLNNIIQKKLYEASNKYLELEADENAITAKVIQKQIKKKDSVMTFAQLADIFLENKAKSGKIKSYQADKSRVNHFKNFLPNGDISFPEITELLLKKYTTYLKTEKKNKERSVINNLIMIRTLFNLAIREGIVDRKYYPFGHGKIIIKHPQSIKIGLTKEEVKILEDIDLGKSGWLWHARNVWLISFYFAGMRVSDVLQLKWSDFKNDRLYYTMDKNQKTGSLKIPEKAYNIIKQYKHDKRSKTDYIFPDLKTADKLSIEDLTRKMNTATKQLNKYLKRVGEQAEIDKKLTMHIARHTFGNISGDLIPIQMLQKLYRHSSITTTINYQSNFIFKDADDALDSVIKT